MPSYGDFLTLFHADPSPFVAAFSLLVATITGHLWNALWAGNARRRDVSWFRLSRPGSRLRLDDMEFHVDSQDIHIKNNRRKKVEGVSIVFDKKPKQFKFDRTTSYDTDESQDGKFTITIDEILAKEEVVLRVDEITNAKRKVFVILPELLGVHHGGGECRKVTPELREKIRRTTFGAFAGFLKSASLTLALFVAVYAAVMAKVM